MVTSKNTMLEFQKAVPGVPKISAQTAAPTPSMFRPRTILRRQVKDMLLA